MAISATVGADRRAKVTVANGETRVRFTPMPKGIVAQW
jgi:hypothetical protein